jgi:hypothetical protein
MKPLITPSTKFLANQELLASQIDDEIVMMNENQGSYYGLNPVAATIWELLKQPLTLQELVTNLLNTYEVSEAQCRQDVEEFLYQLLEQNLIELVN